jgi:outer membrane protein W
MKKIMIGVIITALAVPVFSQGKDYATKGIWEIGGSVSYNSNTITYKGTNGFPDTDTTYKTLTFAPEVSYFVIDNFSLGLMLEYVNNKSEEENYNDITDEIETYTDKSHSTTLFLTPTYVFKQDKIYPYIGALLGTYSTSWDESATKYGLRGGVKIKIGENGLLNLGLQYLFGSGEIKNEEKVDIATKDLKLSAGLSIYF